jgi:hypothetical protein
LNQPKEQLLDDRSVCISLHVAGREGGING